MAFVTKASQPEIDSGIDYCNKRELCWKEGNITGEMSAIRRRELHSVFIPDNNVSSSRCTRARPLFTRSRPSTEKPTLEQFDLVPTPPSDAVVEVIRSRLISSPSRPHLPLLSRSRNSSVTLDLLHPDGNSIPKPYGVLCLSFRGEISRISQDRTAPGRGTGRY